MTDTVGAAMAHDYAHPGTGRSRAAVLGVLWSALHTAVPTLGAGLVFFVAARYLSPVEFGVVGLAASIVAFVTALAPGAFGEALIQRRDIDRDHMNAVFWLTSATGGLLFLVLLASSSRIAAGTGEASLGLLLPFLALKLPFDLAATVPNALIVRSMQFRLIALRTTLATGIGMALCLGLLFAGQGYWALAVSQVSVSVVNCIAAYWVTRWRPGAGLSLSRLRELARYSLFASGTRMLNLMSLDQILVGLLAGAPVLGLYYFARRLFTLLNSMIAGALSSVSHVLLSSLQGDPGKVREALFLATFASSLIAFPVFAGIALIADDLVPLVFGADWAGAIVPIQAFSAIGVLAGIGIVQGALVTSQGRAGAWFLYQLAQQVTTLGIVALLHDDLGQMMIAIAVKTALLWPLSVAMTVRLLGCPTFSYLRAFLAPTMATLVMAAGVVLVPVLLSGADAAVILPVQIVAGLLLYPPALIALGHGRLRELYRRAKTKGH
ncbi:MAG: oligosaccharide flippase family protein [Albidovulum sp.]|uniref:oligosaccharide flippase family protein n=1 Tax=Albidovulum sp. TaxID=1872424 RepID=UPI003CB9A7A9